MACHNGGSNIDTQANVRWAFDGDPALTNRTFSVTGAGQFTTNASGVGYFGTATRFGSRTGLHGVNGQALGISGTLPAGERDLRLGLVDTASPATPVALVGAAPRTRRGRGRDHAEDFDDADLGSLPADWTTSAGSWTATVVGRSRRHRPIPNPWPGGPKGTGCEPRTRYPAIKKAA